MSMGLTPAMEDSLNRHIPILAFSYRRVLKLKENYPF